MHEHMTSAQYRNLPETKASGNKFGAKKTRYGGRLFDSKAEAHRAYELAMMKRDGSVKRIEYQPKFDCKVKGKLVCVYMADFRVTYSDGRVEIEDVKGLKKGASYAVFKLKKKLVEALHGVTIVEV